MFGIGSPLYGVFGIGSPLYGVFGIGSPLYGMFGHGQRHGSRQVAGGRAALEVDTLPDAALVELGVFHHVVAVTNALGMHLVESLQTHGFR